jgi:hypothetical protein
MVGFNPLMSYLVMLPWYPFKFGVPSSAPLFTPQSSFWAVTKKKEKRKKKKEKRK